MSPIGNILLMKCENDLTLDLNKVIPLLPGVSVQRIKTVAIMLGITINK